MNSYFLSSDHAAPSVDLNQLVNGGTNHGILKIFHDGPQDYANAELAVAASLSDSGDYMAGSTTLVGVQDTVESLGGGGLIVGIDASPFSAPLTVSSGEVGSLLAITQKVPTGELGWVGGAPTDGQFLGYTTVDGIKWQAVPGGTVTSVSADSTTGLTVSVDNPTTTPSIHIDLPSGGSVGQVLGVTATGPQTIGWIDNSITPLPAGVAVLSVLSDPWDGFIGFVYDDPNVTSTTVVHATSWLTTPSANNEASGYLYALAAPEGVGSHTSPCIVIFSTNEDDAGKTISWSIVTYNGISNI